jgi:hypothetical protein
MPKLQFRSSLLCVLALACALSCRSKKTSQTNNNVVVEPSVNVDTAVRAPKPDLPMRTTGNMAALAPVIIYKTKKDYTHQVAVQLSEDKKQLLSYPAPSDLMVDGKLTFPDKLQNGFLLDKTGVTLRTAYLKITVEEYTRAGAFPPPPEEMLKNILDDDPILEMYNCGPKAKYSDPAAEINRYISDGKMGTFERLK